MEPGPCASPPPEPCQARKGAALRGTQVSAAGRLGSMVGSEFRAGPATLSQSSSGFTTRGRLGKNTKSGRHQRRSDMQNAGPSSHQRIPFEDEPGGGFGTIFARIRGSRSI